MGIGQTEILIIFVVVLLVFGPKRIPEVANFIGKAMRQFRKASQEIQDSINKEVIRQEREERLKKAQAYDAQAGIPSNPPAASLTAENPPQEVHPTDGDEAIDATESDAYDPYDFSDQDESPSFAPAETGSEAEEPGTKPGESLKTED